MVFRGVVFYTIYNKIPCSILKYLNIGIEGRDFILKYNIAFDTNFSHPILPIFHNAKSMQAIFVKYFYLKTTPLNTYIHICSKISK